MPIVAVVFDNVDDRQLEQRGHVQRLVEAALVHRAVAEEAHGRAFQPLVFQPIGQPEPERRLSADDAVAAPIVLVRREEVHRAALAFRAARGFAIKLGHALVHAHADGEGVAVVAVGGDDVVIVAHERAGADGDGFLADVEVEKAAHFSAVVLLQRLLLKAPHPQHLPQQPDFVFGGEGFVDRGERVIGGFDGSAHIKNGSAQTAVVY